MFMNWGGGERRAPPCIVKSSTGTEAAMFPMWLSSSSLMPVEGQIIDLGWPSRVKKPKHAHTKRHCKHVTQQLNESALFCFFQMSNVWRTGSNGSLESSNLPNCFILPGQGESSQCLMWRIFSSLERACASSQILSYFAISSCRQEHTHETLSEARLRFTDWVTSLGPFMGLFSVSSHHLPFI